MKIKALWIFLKRVRLAGLSYSTKEHLKQISWWVLEALLNQKIGLLFLELLQILAKTGKKDQMIHGFGENKTVFYVNLWF